MSDKYILDEDGNPKPEPDLIAWARWMEGRPDRVVGVDKIEDATVSTVFLGLDHSFGRGAPLLFETMVFGGPHDQWQDRYSTRAEAQAGHKRAVAMVRESEHGA